MKKIIKIGTRDSELALWQAHQVQDKLTDLGYETALVAVKSDGDLLLDKPLYELGITGIFTKTLDIAMLNGTVDIAVHSMKDVPTSLPKGIVQAAVLERANPLDLLVSPNPFHFSDEKAIIATGSLRRQAQWWHRFPEHQLVDLRGNVNTRLHKLSTNNWDGAIFASAGLERIQLVANNKVKTADFEGFAHELDWMIPAPAQGAMLVVALENDAFAREALEKLNHQESEMCTKIERDFLKTLEGGCTAPIGALAKIEKSKIVFEGVLFSIDGKTKHHIKKYCTFDAVNDFGSSCAKDILMNGGIATMNAIRLNLNK